MAEDQPRRPRHEARFPAFLVLVFFVALVVRLAFVIDARRSPFMAQRIFDEEAYHDLAQDLLQGRWPGRHALFRPPLYTFVVAAIEWAVGDDVTTVRLVQGALGALTAPVTVWIGAQALGSVRQGLAAGLIVAFYGPLVFFDTQLLAASLDALFVVAIVALVLRADASHRTRDWILAGAMCGLSATNRGSAVLLVPALTLWAFVKRDPTVPRIAVLRQLAAFAAASTLVVLPVAWHNARNDERPDKDWVHQGPAGPRAVASAATTLWRLATGSCSPLGWGDGVNFYIGNDPDVVELNRDSNPEHFLWFIELGEEPWQHGVKTAHDYSSWFKTKARQSALAHPFRWLALVGHKLLEAANGYEVPRGTNPYAEREFSPLLSALLWQGPLRFPTGLVLPLAVAGGWVLRRERRLLMIAFVMATQLGFVVTFFVTSRYRLPALPLAAVLAVGLVARASAAVARVRTGGESPARVALGGAALFGLVIASNVRLAGQAFARSPVEHFYVALKLAHDGDAREALDHTRAALALAPDYLEAHLFLGMLLRSRGEPVAAADEERAALRIRPHNARAETELGSALRNAGDLDGAEQAYRAAASDASGDPEPRLLLGLLLMARSRPNDAVPWLEEARRLDPSDPRLPAVKAARDGVTRSSP